MDSLASPDALRILALLGLGFWTALDTTAFLQIMISQPLVAGSLAGWILGDPGGGLGVGLLLQLLSMRALPMGGAVIPLAGPAAVVAGAVAASGPRTFHSGSYEFPGAFPLAAALLLALLLEEGGRRGVRWLRGMRGGRLREAEAAVARDDIGRLPRLNARGVVEDGLLGLLLVAGGLFAGGLLLELGRVLPGADGRWVVAPVLGVGVVRSLSVFGVGPRLRRTG